MAEHLLCKERVRSSSLLVSTTPGELDGGNRSCARQHHNRTEELGSNPETTSGPQATPTAVRGLVLEPSSRARPKSIAPLIRALSQMGRPPTSGSLGPSPVRRRAGGPPGPHLTNWIRVSAVNRDLRFRRVLSRIIPTPPVTDRLVRCWRGSSYKGHEVDALAPRADEGRGRLRKAPGSREQTSIRRCPNGETRLGSCPVPPG